MRIEVWSLAITSHLHDISTDVRLFGSLEDAQDCMKKSYEGNLELLDAVDNHYDFHIEDMGASIIDDNCEEIYIDWTIESHFIELRFGNK